MIVGQANVHIWNFTVLLYPSYILTTFKFTLSICLIICLKNNNCLVCSVKFVAHNLEFNIASQMACTFKIKYYVSTNKARVTVIPLIRVIWSGKNVSVTIFLI